MKTNDVSELRTDLKALIEKLDRVLFGDPPETAGLIVKVDRLEQSEMRRRWGFRVLVASVLGLIGKALIAYFAAK
ncbi:MAG TPA: hypothetical protein VFE46_10825 [Pirellulales bacterium]|nr:hypothetical protein [Pirellulales bacterium]